MILVVFSHAGKGVSCGDIVARENVGIADAGELKYLRRLYRTSAENNLFSGLSDISAFETELV